MRVLVTGGAGFIGSTLVDRLLDEGDEVDVVDNLSSGSRTNIASAESHSNVCQFHELDIRSSEFGAIVNERRPEIIYHLAAQVSVAVSVREPLMDAELNVLGSLHVLDAARSSGVKKVVFAASGGTLYGDVPRSELPIAESRPHNSSSPYGLAKRVVCDYLRLYQELYGLDFAALALANVYGPRQDPHGEAGVVAIFARKLIAGSPATIHGDGSQTRDFVHVNDVVDAFIKAAKVDGGSLFNIGTGIQTSVNELYEALASQVDGASAAIHGPARNGEVDASALDSTLANDVLGWIPKVDLGEGVRSVLAFERQRPNS
jgi:UDP-glucose 4-epimerase